MRGLNLMVQDGNSCILGVSTEKTNARKDICWYCVYHFYFHHIGQNHLATHGCKKYTSIIFISSVHQKCAYSIILGTDEWIDIRAQLAVFTTSPVKNQATTGPEAIRAQCVHMDGWEGMSFICMSHNILYRCFLSEGVSSSRQDMHVKKDT